MPADELISLRPGTRLVRVSRGEYALKGPGARLPLGDPAPGILAAIRKMFAGGAPFEELFTTAARKGSEHGPSQFLSFISELEESGLLCRTLLWKGARLLTVIPLAREFQPAPESKQLTGTRRFVLSRFAYLRRRDGRLVLESPLARARVELEDERASLILNVLSRPRSVLAACKFVRGISRAEMQAIFQLLFQTGFLSPVNIRGIALETNRTSLRQWEFHDLLFHSRSRAGRHANPYGSVYRYPRAAALEPALKPAMSPQKVRLFRPKIEKLMASDISLTRALEERLSIRRHARTPVTSRELGEFLYRTGRVRRFMRRGGLKLACRVYPGAGAAYELEIYPLIRSCEGLAAGLYQYLPRAHALCKLSPWNERLEVLMASAANTLRAPAPQVLLIVTARFRRVTWKYGSLAYAVILKDVGVLFQTFYLVATAMGLAACALGGGNSDLFASAAGLNYFSESSVGEFAVGKPEKSIRRQPSHG